MYKLCTSRITKQKTTIKKVSEVFKLDIHISWKTIVGFFNEFTDTIFL